MKSNSMLALLKVLPICLVVVGCGGKNNGPGEIIIEPDDPEELVTFNVWMPLEPWSISSFTNRDFGENEVIKEIEKKFNVKFNFTHPATGSEVDQFSLMVAGKELPDLIFSPSWYAGGIEAGIREGVYVDFTKYLDEYCPNYKKVLDEDPEIKRIVQTDSKQIACFYSVSPYEEWCYYGPIFKSKWLQDVGEEVPVTIDDWERVLTKFKTVKGANAPFVLSPTGWDYSAGTFLSAYGVAPSFYLDENGEMKYGLYEDGFFQYLNKMRDWIKKGLVDPNFNEKDWNDELNQILSNDSGVIMQSPDTMSVYFENAGISWVAADYPKLHASDNLRYRLKNFRVTNGWMTAAAITPNCKHIGRLLKVLDYGYSEEGAELYNFGIKGRSYTVNEETGEKEFTDLIYNNKYGLTPTQCVWRYKVHNGLFIRDEHHANPILVANPQSMAARQMWSEIDTSAVIPPLTYTKSENQDIGAATTIMNQYIQTQTLSFLTGRQNDLSGNADVITDPSNYRANLVAKGLNDVLQICKDAYARYLAR